MEYCWIILLILVIAYFDLKSDLKKVLNYINKNSKKDLSLLDKLKGKEVELEIDNDDITSFTSARKGILKDYNDIWLILETNDSKGKKTLYFRMINVKGVVEVKEKSNS